MYQNFEQYRDRGPHEARPMTSGANALDLLPRVDSRPQLHIVKQVSELPPPISLLSRRNGALVEIPKNPEALTRQQIIKEAPEAKPEKFIEREIDPDKPWSAFGQVMFIKEYNIDGKIIKKIAAISIAYPGGVGTKMAGEALSKTSGIDRTKFEQWDGEIEGAIIAAEKEVPDVMQQFDLMDAFIENSGTVIEERHAQAEHEVVQHFFGLQGARKDFLKTVKEDAGAILMNPEFTGRSAVDPRYMNQGVYLVEGIIEDGVWSGGDPNGEKMPLLKMASDEAHKKWLQWAEKTAAEMKGDGIIVDAEDTETVQTCGGADNKCGEKKGCSAFFEKMEGGSLKPSDKLNDYTIVNGIAGAVAASEYSESHTSGGGGAPANERETCSSCRKYKYEEDGCKCSPNAQ